MSTARSASMAWAPTMARTTRRLHDERARSSCDIQTPIVRIVCGSASPSKLRGGSVSERISTDLLIPRKDSFPAPLDHFARIGSGSAGENDMPSTEKDCELSRRNVLRGATMLVGGAVVVAGSLAPAAAQSGKMTQKAAEYQNGPKNGQKC